MQLSSLLFSKDQVFSVQEHLIQALATFEVVNPSPQNPTWYFLFDWAEGDLNNFWMNNLHLVRDHNYLPWMARQFHGLTKGLRCVHNERTETIKSFDIQNRANSNTLYGCHGDINIGNILWFPSEPLPGILSLSDFGLGRLHRSIQDSRPCKRLETYRAPESGLEENSISRISDIFSLGCVFLEFVVWFFRGIDGLEKSSQDRLELDIHNFTADTFFTFNRETVASGRKFFIKQSVRDLIEELQTDPDCTTYLWQLLDIIVNEMLEPDPSKRIETSRLERYMKALWRECENDSDFYTLKTLKCINLDNLDSTNTYVPNDLNSDSEGSITSNAFSHESASTASSSVYDVDTANAAVAVLVEQLCSDCVLEDLYSQSVEKINKDRFCRGHNKLLKDLFEGLWSITTDPVLQKIAKFLCRQRKSITSRVFDRFDAARSSLPRHYPDHQINVPLLSRQIESIESAKRPESPARAPGREWPTRMDIVEQDEESENSENDDEGATDDDEYDQDNDLRQLENVLSFIIGGPSFETFKLNLSCFVNPPTTIPAALSIRNLRSLRRLLRVSFDRVTEGEYSWLRELVDLGYKRNEIAELLLEDASDSPWIFFDSDSESISGSEVDTQRHLPGCVHQLSWTNDLQNGSLTNEAPDSYNFIPEIQRLCGLAGITPSNRNQDTWNGSVNFDEQNSIAIISYSRQDLHEVVPRVEKVLKRVNAALGHAQSKDLCCESFTILCCSAKPAVEESLTISMVETCRLHFSLVSQMLEEMQPFSTHRESQKFKIPVSAKTILRLFAAFGGLDFDEDQDLPMVLHLCSLATQILSIGFVSYMQGHTGQLHPFFLDSPIKRIRLLGSSQNMERYPCIELGSKDLTCLGKMLQNPVLVFNELQLVQSVYQASDDLTPERFDLLVNPEDLIDTWGPGSFIKSSTDGTPPFAIWIRGGVLFASDLDGSKFHWRQGTLLEGSCPCKMDLHAKLRIGASIRVNNDCPLDEGPFRDRFAEHLDPLGTWSSSWYLAERQLGIQSGGPYSLITANASEHRDKPKTLKESRLDNLITRLGKLDEGKLLSFLEERWAVQVSLCTHIARRVPLRQMVIDLLPIFAAELTQKNEWELLRDDLRIFDELQRDDIGSWLLKLDKECHDLVVHLICIILESMRHTGLDNSGKFLQVAWPCTNDREHCLKIDLGRPESSWIHLIADSPDCATFAYFSRTCLQTDKILCRQANTSWCSSILLLETAVMVYPVPEPGSSSTTAACQLRDNTIYHFEKLEKKITLVRAEIQSSGTTERPTVLKPCTEMAEKLMYRLKHTRRPHPRLRERRRLDGVRENFVFLTSTSS